MINDYVWTQLYAQRQEELRARARRRGGDPASASRRRTGPVGWLRLRLGRRRVTAPQAGSATATAGQVRSLPAHASADARPATPRPAASTKEAA